MKTFSPYIIEKLLECRSLTTECYKQKSYSNQKNSQIIVDRDIIAIGDIHGDIQLMLDTLKIGGLIQLINLNNSNAIKIIRKDKKDTIEYYEWIGGNKIVVQVGDQIDRCRPTTNGFNNCKEQDTTYQDEASDIEILLFFTKLHQKALVEGGAVYSLLGNHELMNIIGDISYVSYKNFDQLQIEDREENVIIDEITKVINKTNNNSIDHNMQRRKNIFRPGGILAKFIACTRYSILIVNGYLFVHGGVLDSFRKHYDKKIEDFDLLNTEIKKFINDDKNSNHSSLNFYNKMIDFIFRTNYSPFITRDLTDVTTDEKIKPCTHVKTIIEHYGLKGIIIGHTIQLNGINGSCPDGNGKNTLFKIDVGSSKAFNFMPNQPKAQVLKISKDSKTYVLRYGENSKIISKLI